MESILIPVFMNPPAIRALRKKMAAGDACAGLWITLESPSITEMAVACGADWVVLDAEHGHLDWSQLVAHLRCVARSNTVALIRLATIDDGLIKRALDIGADGVVLPWVETPDQLARGVAAATYPPEGRRGIGAERATLWGAGIADHVREARDHTLVVPLIESVRAAENIEALAQVDGVEFYYFGPADFTATAGSAGEWETPEVAESMRRCVEVLRRHNRYAGVVCRDRDDMARRRQEGFQMLGAGLDAGLLFGRLRERFTEINKLP